jgi:hypothetical protein
VTLALLTFTTLSEWRSRGVVITKFSGHELILRSSPTVFADTAMPESTSIRMWPGNPPSAMCSAPMLLGLYCMTSSHFVFAIQNAACGPSRLAWRGAGTTISTTATNSMPKEYNFRCVCGFRKRLTLHRYLPRLPKRNVPHRGFLICCALLSPVSLPMNWPGFLLRPIDSQ